MNKQEQIEKMAKVISSSCNREGIAKRCPERIIVALAEAGYINGADFVEWLSTYKEGGNDTYFNTLEINFLKRLLQEYLKGE